MPIILAVDTSAKPVSCAIAQDQRILGSFYVNNGLTHSQTLMPMIQHLLEITGLTVNQLDAVAVNAGPGSFTGVRIGVSAVKGLAFTDNLPCVSVSTLEAMAVQVSAPCGTLVCGTMDARCQQVYTALFEINQAGKPVRLTADAALTLNQLEEMLKNQDRPIILVGDGSELTYKALNSTIPQLSLAPAPVRYQNASGTALVAMEKLLSDETVTAEDLLPEYLRLPQAERELNSKLASK
ncbi:MAG: tRNA (adenosine(37)-N6)-threonylcarbamoyltransferase complex dimerization subunit type 1 TsaB [Ruminococcaceae bacterium]|nr:tRNA (adenosine(37)-N6)-threonylcarbamoyltransferase complex dimerization subunit type 1 TsaB [Oscillospiraceae bacterium]